MSGTGRGLGWPEAPADGWLETCATVQRWTQIVGKARLARAPKLNHYWQATLYVTARSSLYRIRLKNAGIRP